MDGGVDTLRASLNGIRKGALRIREGSSGRASH